jgi:hypothetical protein
MLKGVVFMHRYARHCEAILLGSAPTCGCRTRCCCCCCAGLSAARQLFNHGYKVVVVEGADRPGGRVFTQRLEVSMYTQLLISH